MKAIQILLFLFLTISGSHSALAQFTPGLRFAGNVAYVDFEGSPQIGYDYEVTSISSMGAGPFFTMEANRVLLQAAFIRYSNSYSASFETIPYSETIKFKPNQFIFICGYKINANKEVKFYPFAGINKYSLGMEYEKSTSKGTVLVKDQLSLIGFTFGAGSYYIYKQLTFDIQARLSFGQGFYGDYDVFGYIPDFSVGVGYALSGGGRPRSK